MSASLAPSAAPANALRIWCDARQVYVELPTKPTCTPCIMTFPRNAVGLSKALAIVYGHADNSCADPANFKSGRKLIGSPTQHASAEAILRRARIIK